MSGIKIHGVKEQTHLYLVFWISQGESMLFLGPWILTNLVHDQDNQMLGRFLWVSLFRVIGYDWPREAVVCWRLSPVTHLDSIMSGFSASLLPSVSRDSPCLCPGSFFPFQLFFGGFPLAGAPVSLLLALPFFSSVACGLLAAQSRMCVCSHPCSRAFMYDVGPWSSSYSCSYPFLPHRFLMTQMQIIFEDRKVPCGPPASASSLYPRNGDCDCRTWQRWQN